MAIFLGESFDRGFTIDHRGDDLALLARFLGADYDIVTIADRDIDHGVADDFEEEKLALSY